MAKKRKSDMSNMKLGDFGVEVEEGKKRKKVFRSAKEMLEYVEKKYGKVE